MLEIPAIPFGIPCSQERLSAAEGTKLPWPWESLDTELYRKNPKEASGEKKHKLRLMLNVKPGGFHKHGGSITLKKSTLVFL